MELGKCLKGQDLPSARFGTLAPPNCQVIMIAHLSSQLIEDRDRDL